MTWGKQWREAWQALGQADLGETADFSQMLQRLGASEEEAARLTPAPVSTASLIERRPLIALVSRGPAIRAAMDYVRDALARFNADLAVINGADAPAIDRRFTASCAGQGANVTEQTLSGGFEPGVLRFLAAHPQTMFVVLGDRTLPRQGLPRLPVPLVMVRDLEVAAERDSGGGQ